MHVLIVEDEARPAAAVQEVLDALGGCSVSIAETEQDAVSDAMRQRPDLIISDVRLREGTGPAAVGRIRAAIGPVSAFYVTASPEIARALDPEARILVKPVLRRDLADAVRAHAPEMVALRA